MKTNILPSVSIRNRFTSGILWSIAGAISNSGFNFTLTIIIARIFGKELFGEFSMIQSTMLTLSGTAQLATGYTANKYVAEFRSTDKEKTGRIIGLCSVISTLTACMAMIVLLVGAPWLATHWLKAPHLSSSLIIAAGMVFFAVINGYQAGVLAGLESYQQMTRATILCSFLNLVFCGFGALVFGLNGAIAAMTISSLSQWLIFRYILSVESANQGIIIYLRDIMKERTIFLRFALPAAISGLISMPALWLANTFLVRQPAGFSQMALYSAALNMRSLVLFLPLVLNKVTMSLLNNQIGLNDEYRYRKLFWANLTITGSSVIVGAIFVALIGPWLLTILGKDFKDGYPVLLVMLLATIIDGISQALYQIIQSQQKMWLSFWTIALPRDMTIILLAYFLTPLYGAIGLAWAYTAGWFLAFCVISIHSFRIGLMPNKLTSTRQI